MKLNYFKKVNQKGFIHHIILPTLAIVAVATIGVYVLTASHADTISQMVFVSNADNFSLYTTPASGPAKRIVNDKTGLSTVTSGPDYMLATYTQNSSVIFYLSTYTEASNINTYKLMSVNPNGQNNKVIKKLSLPYTPGYGYFVSLLWSETAQKLALLARIGPTEYEVYTLNANGTGLTKIYTGYANVAVLAWSPDGTKFVTDLNPSATSSTYPTYIMGADGSNPTSIGTECNGGSARYSWSPDSSTVYCYTTGTNTTSSGTTTEEDAINIATKLVSTYNLKLPRIGTMANDVALSPNGQYLLYDTHIASGTTKSQQCNIYVYNISTAKTTEINALTGTYCIGIDWSPNSSQIAYMTATDPNSQGVLGSPEQIYTADVNGKNLRSVYSEDSKAVFLYDLNWSTQ